MMQFASALDTVNTFIDSRGVLGALLVAGISAGVGLWWRGRRPFREISWTVLYDGPVNQPPDKPDKSSQPDTGAPLWEISFQGSPVDDHPSLVLLRVRNSGTGQINATSFDSSLSFGFAGREVMGAKVRDNNQLHQIVEKAGGLKPSSDKKRVELPKFPFNPGGEFKLLVLLQGQPEEHEELDVQGQIIDGRLVRHDVRRPPYRVLAVGTALAVLIAGVTLGVRLANDALTPMAACSGGHLTLEGSSAFAPVANQVKNNYRQLCGQDAVIAITADGSERGLASLERSHSSTTIAMSDGLPDSQAGTETLVRRPVGVVTFAVVANAGLRATLPDLFSQNGISEDELRSLFSGAGSASTPPVIAVGRTHASGTRAAFAGAYFGGTDPEPGKAPACGSGTSGDFCTSDNTMDLLSFVESHPNAIDYAEADALPYFPDVQVIAVNGQLPSEQRVKSADYPFIATEYLYTAGQPAGLAADYLQFLTSPAETAALRGHGFIACGDLAGTKRDGACTQ